MRCVGPSGAVECPLPAAISSHDEARHFQRSDGRSAFRLGPVPGAGGGGEGDLRPRGTGAVGTSAPETRLGGERTPIRIAFIE